MPERARRRRFTAQYKLDVVAEYDAAPAGEKGAVLRREGLYSSHVIEWRRARDAGALAGPARPRGRLAADPRDTQIARLTKEKARLEQELARARFVVDVQAKLPVDDLRGRGHRARVNVVTDQAIALLAPRIGTRAACAASGRGAGQLVPAAPRQPGTPAAAAGAAPRPGPAARSGPGGAGGDPRRAARGAVRRHRARRGLGHPAG